MHIVSRRAIHCGYATKHSAHFGQCAYCTLGRMNTFPKRRLTEGGGPFALRQCRETTFRKLGCNMTLAQDECVCVN